MDLGGHEVNCTLVKEKNCHAYCMNADKPLQQVQEMKKTFKRCADCKHGGTVIRFCECSHNFYLYHP